MAGLLDLLGGTGSNTGSVDLNQLVRPPDPLGAALAEMSQRFATAGQASRLPVSTLGAIGSALGGAGAAAQTQQTQYLDQAIKLQALKRSLQQMGFDQSQMDYLMKKWATLQQAGGGAAPGAPVVPQVAPVAPTTAAPGPPAAAPAAAPAATPAATPSPDYGASGDFPTGLGYNTAPGGPIINSGLLSPDTVVGGAGAATMLNPFRLASLVGSAGGGVGSGSGADPLSLIAKYESGGRNIRQQAVPESVSSASGPWQMLDSTFHEAAKKAGIDVSKYDSAKDAPIETQRAVAQALYDEKGFAPWANYNPRLAAAIGGGTPTGGTASPVSTLRGLLVGSDGGSADPLAGLLVLATGGGDKGGGDEDPLAGLLKPQDEVIPSGGGLPAGMLQRAALGAGSAGYPIPNILPPGGNAAFPALPATGDNQIPIEGPGAPTKPTSFPAEGPNAFTDPTIMQAAASRLAGDGGGNLPIIKAQYAPGSGGGGAPATGAAGAPAVGQGGFPALVGPGSGQIPGLGMTPQEVAILNAMSSLAGHANPPLKEFLDLYYKSPEYLRGAAQATQEGQTAVTGPAQIAIDQAKAANDIRVGMAKDGVMIDPGGSGKVVPIPGYGPAMAYNKDQLEAVTNKWQTKIEETKAGYEPVTVKIKQPDGSFAETTITKAELKNRLDMQGNRTPQAGDIASTPVETPASKFGMQKFGESFDAAQNARLSLENNNRMIKMLDDGIITGTGANSALALQKLGAALGYNGHDRVARTEAFLGSMGSEVANVIKQGKFGPPTSDTDRKFAQDVAGANITLDEQTIRRLFALREQVNRAVIDQHNKEWAPIVPPGSGFNPVINAPPRYGAKTATGPNGQRMWDDNGTWRPM